ncbi:MAG: Hpt domain-containing protein [Bacteroidales bacterium]|nr:Hpt domain-containing protein [Bacteroidales bacterium]MCF8403674.1 Hpt domain-containing protein [Bacteroidales bacterium]
MQLRNNLNNESIAHMPPVDMEDMLNRLQCKDLVIKLLGDFVGCYNDFIDEIMQAIWIGSLKDLKESTHKLKGVLANLSITNACNKCITLHENAESLKQEESMSLVYEIKQELDKVKLFYTSGNSLFS